MRAASLLSRAVAVAITGVATAALVWASQAPFAPVSSAAAVVRLAWRMRPDRIETCQAASQSVLDTLPAHMRQPLVCEGRTATYRLEVHRDGVLLIDEALRGGGLRHDRPIYVARDIRVPPGGLRLSVRVTRREAATADAVAPDARREAVLGEAVPAALVFDQDLVVARGEVALVTYDGDRRQLVLATSR